ncbi:hypothetical protein SEA_NANOSMITE_71 [Mycobacterium phage Nanosmite]|nr:hypothetical protein SEA_NANOSMITE_71 [Mycobacterium phage Nanosmite]
MKGSAVQLFSNDALGAASVAVVVDRSPCTIGRSARMEAPGLRRISSPSAAMERWGATDGLKLTPWQRTLLDGMFARGKIQRG